MYDSGVGRDAQALPTPSPEGSIRRLIRMCASVPSLELSNPLRHPLPLCASLPLRMASLRRLALLSAPLLLLLVASNAEITMKPIECPETLPRWACVGAPAFAPSFHRHPTPPSRRMPGLLPLEETVAYVQDLLQMAIEVEHSTIPLYLTTLYSIRNQSSFAASTIKSVVMEEMLHMVR